MKIDSGKRVEILEDRIRYALSMIEGDYVGEAAMELDRALNDPNMQIGAIVHASDCATHNAPALPVGECDCQ